MQLSEALRTKIRRRARRIWQQNLTVAHRVTEVTPTGLRYRIRRGMFITIRRDKLGRIYVPREA